MMKKIFCIISMISLILTSCSSDIFDNIKEYADTETVYVGKFDKAEGKIGIKRVEIDLLNAGRVSADKVNVGKAVKTIVEYDKEKITYNEVPSWINITNLTEPKLYRFKIYNLDEHGNQSIPVECAYIPFTDVDMANLVVSSPSTTISPATAEFQWVNGLSSGFFDCIGLTYTFTNTEGVHVVTPEDPTSFSLEKLISGTPLNVYVKFTVIPKFNGEPIIDTIDLDIVYPITPPSVEEYLASRENRSVASTYFDGEQGQLTWGEPTTHLVWSEIRYTTNSGETNIVRANAGEYNIVCPNIKRNERYQIRSAFTPTGTQDVFEGNWYTVTEPVLLFNTPFPCGVYTVSPESHRDESEKMPEYANSNKVTISWKGGDVYEISDITGGFYEPGRAYGAEFIWTARLKYDGAVFSLIDADMDYWGYGFEAVAGTFERSTKTINLTVDWSGMVFYLILIST
jgi:hypothetical protein